MDKNIADFSGNGEAAPGRPAVQATSASFKSSRKKPPALTQAPPCSDPVGVWLTRLQNQLRGAMAFNEEYAQWLAEKNRQINELRAALNSHAGDTELQIIVENVATHFEDVFKLKGNAAKLDVFYILSGMWQTPAVLHVDWQLPLI